MEDNTMGVEQESQQTEAADAPNTEQQLTKTEQSQKSETDKNEKEDEWKQKITALEAGNKQTQEMIVALTAQQAAMTEGMTAQMEAMTRIAQSLESAAKPAENPQKAAAAESEQTTEKPEPAPAPTQSEIKAGRKKARKAAWI